MAATYAMADHDGPLVATSADTAIQGTSESTPSVRATGAHLEPSVILMA
jgi:hypothetical protein